MIFQSLFQLFLVMTLGFSNAFAADIRVSVPRDVWGGTITFVAQKGEDPKSLELSSGQGKSEKLGVSYYPVGISERVLEKNGSYILVTRIDSKSDVKMMSQGYPRKVLLEYSETITLYNKYGELLWKKQFVRPPDTPYSEGWSDFDILVKLARNSGVVVVVDGGYGNDGVLPNQFLTIDTTGAEICIKTWVELGLTNLYGIVISESGTYVAISGHAGSNDSIHMIWANDACKVSRLVDDATIHAISDEGVLNVVGGPLQKTIYIDMSGEGGEK